MSYHKVSHSVSLGTNHFQANQNAFNKSNMQTRRPNNSSMVHMVNNKTKLISSNNNNS